MENKIDNRGPAIQTVTLGKSEKWEVLITRGYVQVYIPEFDCEGTQRTVDFPRTGRHVSSKASTHRVGEKYIASAYRAAITAVAIADRNGKL